MDDAAYQQGYVAFVEGYEFSDNPFQDDSDEYDSWASGWSAADEEIENNT